MKRKLLLLREPESRASKFACKLSKLEKSGDGRARRLTVEQGYLGGKVRSTRTSNAFVNPLHDIVLNNAALERTFDSAKPKIK